MHYFLQCCTAIRYCTIWCLKWGTLCGRITLHSRIQRNCNNERVMAKNGSSRCFLAKNGCTLKTIAAESVVGRIWLANTHYLPFLAKSDRVLPVIATLLSFHPFLAIFCSFPVGYSPTRTDQPRPQEQLTAKFRPGDVEVGKIFAFFCKQF